MKKLNGIAVVLAFIAGMQRRNGRRYIHLPLPKILNGPVQRRFGVGDTMYLAGRIGGLTRNRKPAGGYRRNKGPARW